jgi:murein L,D-transpeptidase YafK
MLKQLYIKILLLLVTLFIFSGCQPDTPTHYYNLKECKKELLEATDYREENSIDRIVVIKKERRMYLYKDGNIEEVLPVSLGKNPIGPKQQQGDNRTPEGTFFIHRKLCSPRYYRSLCISYPRPEDRARAAARGVKPGGNITIHAQPTWNANGKGDSYTLRKDWTRGCIAITNAAMRKLWYAVREGVPITIR